MHRHTLTLLMLLLASPVHAQDDAQKLFEAMEQKLTKAKAHKLTFESDETEGRPKMKGTLTLAVGNRFNFTSEVNENGRLTKVVLASDGKVCVRQIDGDTEPGEAQHEKHFDFFSGHLARVGFALGHNMVRGKEPLDPAKLKLSGFKTVGKEKVAGREANVIEYQIVIDGDNRNKFICKLWLDSQTTLPLKRSLALDNGANVVVFVTENYSQWDLDPKLPEDTFALPK